jgi:hypothetical protein
VKAAAVVCRCGGTGKLSHDSGWVDHAEPPNLPEGAEYVSGHRTMSSSLCQCRRDLEPREGEAAWWDSETVFDEVWVASVFQDTAEIVVKAEVPISEDNYRVVRRGNRYYPTSIDLDVSSEELHFLFPDEARELARLLIAAADKCDEIDKPDCDRCGHWHPCDCSLGSA